MEGGDKKAPSPNADTLHIAVHAAVPAVQIREVAGKKGGGNCNS